MIFWVKWNIFLFSNLGFQFSKTSRKQVNIWFLKRIRNVYKAWTMLNFIIIFDNYLSKIKCFPLKFLKNIKNAWKTIKMNFKPIFDDFLSKLNVWLFTLFVFLFFTHFKTGKQGNIRFSDYQKRLKIIKMNFKIIFDDLQRK